MPRKKKEDTEILAELSGMTVEASKEAIETAQQIFSDPSVGRTLVEDTTVEGELVVTDKFVRNEDGTVNWRKMIKPEYIVLNGQFKDAMERQYGKPMGELSVEEVDDKYLLILLAGFKEVAKLRGFHAVMYPTITAQPGFVSVYCQINWKSFENEDAFTQGDGADATHENTDGFGQKYLTAIAFNRAFVRAVRSSLDIHVVGKDEISGAVRIDTGAGGGSPTGPKAVLKAKLDKMGRTVEQFAKWYADNQHFEEAREWRTLDDIPDEYVWTILGIFKKLEDEKKKK